MAPLAARHVAGLVHELSRNTLLPNDIVEEIVERADGVPLFVEELTKRTHDRPWVAGLRCAQDGSAHCASSKTTSASRPAIVRMIAHRGHLQAGDDIEPRYTGRPSPPPASARFGLVTPYASGYADRIPPHFQAQGYACVGQAHAGLSDGVSYCVVADTDVAAMVRAVTR